MLCWRTFLADLQFKSNLKLSTGDVEADLYILFLRLVSRAFAV